MTCDRTRRWSLLLAPPFKQQNVNVLTLVQVFIHFSTCHLHINTARERRPQVWAHTACLHRHAQGSPPFPFPTNRMRRPPSPPHYSQHLPPPPPPSNLHSVAFIRSFFGCIVGKATTFTIRTDYNYTCLIESKCHPVNDTQHSQQQQTHGSDISLSNRSHLIDCYLQLLCGVTDKGRPAELVLCLATCPE